MTKQTATAVMFEDVFGDCYVHLAQPQEPDGERDFFVPPHMTLGAMPGDIVEVSIRSFSSVPESFRFVSSLARSGRCYQCYATVRRILDYADVLCSGRFESGEDGRFVADDERIAPVPVFKTKRQSVTDGAKVLASITRRKYSKIHKASVVNSYGDSRLFEPNYRAQLDEVCGNMGFDSDVTVPVPAVSDERQDLRALDTFVFGASSGGIACSVEKKTTGGYYIYITRMSILSCLAAVRRMLCWRSVCTALILRAACCTFFPSSWHVPLLSLKKRTEPQSHSCLTSIRRAPSGRCTLSAA